MVRFLWSVAILGLINPAIGLRANEDWPINRGPSHEPNPVQYDPRNYEKIPAEFREDSAACVLYSGNSYTVEPDGTIENTTHDITRLYGRKAIEKLGEYRGITYTPSHQKLTLHEARIHKTNGTTVNIQPRHLQLRDVATDFQVYDRDKQVIISFPALEVGDTIEVKWSVRGKNPEHGGHFFTRYTFGDLTYPVIRDELRIVLPGIRPFHFTSVNGQVKPDRTELQDKVLYCWFQQNIPQPSQDENLPPRDELHPSIVCSTFPSWQAVGQWKHQLRNECWKCEEDLRKVVQEVTRGIPDPTARAQALTYWLRRNIRYVSSGEKHDYTPHLPNAVLANRFGDCKDTSQMLAVMLREAGIKVELATLGTLEDGQVVESIPSPWGTHAILLVTIDGKEHWIDTTSSMAGWNFLPHDDRDRICYLVDETGKLRLHRTPAADANDYRLEQKTNLFIGADGSSRSERQIISLGSAAMAVREKFLEVPSGERRRQIATELQDSNNASHLVRLKIDEPSLREFDQPTRVHFVFEIPGHFSGSPDLEGSFSDSKIWSSLLAHNIDFDRQTPFQLYTPFESRHRFLVHIHPALRLDSSPIDHQIVSPWGVHVRRVKDTENGLEIEMVTRINRIKVEPADFERFRKFQEEISKSYRVWLTLKPVDDLSQAPLLEALVRFTPDDPAATIALARLYQQNKKLEAARALLTRAREYLPENLSLGELAVKCASNPEEEESLQRDLVEQFPNDVAQSLVLANILIQRQKQPDARNLLEKLKTRGTSAQRAQTFFYLARSYYRTNQADEANACFDKALEAHEESVLTVKGLTLRGQILEKLGRPRDAFLSYQKAAIIDREADAALDALVRLSIADNKPLEALEFLNRYVVSVGDDTSGLLLAAEYYLRLNHFEDALDLASRVREKTFHEKSQRILGLVWLHRKDWARAADHLDKASIDSTVLEGLLRSFLNQGKLQEAIHRIDLLPQVKTPSPELAQRVQQVKKLADQRERYWKDLSPALPSEKKDFLMEILDNHDVFKMKWLTRSTPRDEMMVSLGYLVCAEEIYRENGPRDLVNQLLSQAQKGRSEVPAIQAFRARLLLDQGKFSKALAQAESALQANPLLSNALYVRGRIRLERDLPGAAADLEKANTLKNKTDAAVLQSLAEALEKGGRIEEAISHLREAVKLRPADRDLAEQLDSLEKVKASSKKAAG